MSWREQPMVGFDTETDGPDPEDARIITACVGEASEAGWEPHSWLLGPERPIPAEATAIHGVTTEHAEEHGQDRASAIPQIRDALTAAWNRDWPIVGHNIVYDLTVLDRELRRIGERGLRVTGPVIDTLVLDKAVDRYRRGSRRLVDVAAYYGITLSAEQAHGAEADALTAARLAWKLGGRVAGDYVRGDVLNHLHGGKPPAAPTLDSLSLRELHSFQVEAFEAQRLSFIEYRRRKGEPLDDESTDWPLRPAA